MSSPAQKSILLVEDEEALAGSRELSEEALKGERRLANKIAGLL